MNKSGRGGFKPGQSGNPGGRPKRHIGDLSRESRRYGQLALGTLVKICRSGLERNRLTAAKELLDRGYGRALQMVDVAVLTKKLNELTPDELAALEARLLTAASEESETRERQQELFH